MKTAAAVLLTLVCLDVRAAELVRARYLMGTICEISVPAASDAGANVDAAFAEGARIEAMLSTWRRDSELSRLNRGEITKVSPELDGLLRDSIGWCRKTGGAFNPLMRPLIDAWQTRKNGAIPTDQNRIAAMKRAQLTNVSFDGDTIKLANGAQFEEGAFGKGYALDRMIRLLRDRGVTAAMINFGGQLAGYGATRTVTIADPRHRDTPLVSLPLKHGSLSTSSGSEKQFLKKGRHFSHIIDPATGQALPPRGSASVIHDSALIADILSTALYVMGPEKGIAWANDHEVDAIFITDSGQIIRSKTGD